MEKKYSTSKPSWVPEEPNEKFACSVMGGIEGIKDTTVGNINPALQSGKMKPKRRLIMSEDDYVDGVYNSVLINGTHKAPSIRVAEASKIIENSQRDVNIAFMNELAKIFNAMDIDTHDVIEAAATKWNFIKLSPSSRKHRCTASCRA